MDVFIRHTVVVTQKVMSGQKYIPVLKMLEFVICSLTNPILPARMLIPMLDQKLRRSALIIKVLSMVVLRTLMYIVMS